MTTQSHAGHDGADTDANEFVEILSSSLIDPQTQRWLQTCLTTLCAHAAPKLRRLTISLVDDAAMQVLHTRHMNDPTTTDVLTFADGEQVDVAVCVCEATRRSAEMGHALQRELLLYCLHGLLHAVGFDDRTPLDYARMHAEEDRLLAVIGVQATFAPEGGGA